MRILLLALASWMVAGASFALEPAELAGAWVTEWSNNADEPTSGGAPMMIRLDSPGALDGMWPASGPDGVIFGETETRDDGALIWSGDWSTVWPEGVTRGTFRFVFTDANTFTGTWSSADSGVTDAAWNGRRASENDRAD